MDHDANDVQVTDLTGRLLIAMPGMGDPRFAKSVILLCAHGPDAAMGLIINKPAPEIGFDTLLEQLDIPGAERARGKPIHFGGPVEGGRGFVLHSRDYAGAEGTLKVGVSFGMTATMDILRDIGRGAGPDRMLVALGYAGWGPGQLESEIARNGWLVSDAEPDLVFDMADDRKWLAAISHMGIDPISLSGSAGRA